MKNQFSRANILGQVSLPSLALRKSSTGLPGLRVSSGS